MSLNLASSRFLTTANPDFFRVASLVRVTSTTSENFELALPLACVMYEILEGITLLT